MTRDLEKFPLEPRPRREVSFSRWLVDGGRRRKASRAEIVEAHRLWRAHADIRRGVAS